MKVRHSSQCAWGQQAWDLLQCLLGVGYGENLHGLTLSQPEKEVKRWLFFCWVMYLAVLRNFKFKTTHPSSAMLLYFSAHRVVINSAYHSEWHSHDDSQGSSIYWHL